jgi:hypothetical protein
MKSIKNIGIVEKILNHFGYYKPVVKKTRKVRTPRAINVEQGNSVPPVEPLSP